MYGSGNNPEERTYPYDTYQQNPEYTAGSYQFDTNGNFVGLNKT